MFFQWAWLVATSKWQSNLAFLIEASDEATARAVCSKHSIAVFSFSVYTQPPENYGKVFFRCDEWGKLVTFYSQHVKAKDAFTDFTDAGFNIKYINNVDHLLSDADVVRVIEKLHIDYDEQHRAKNEDEKSYFSQLTDLVLKRGTEELTEIKILATKAVEDSERLLVKAQWTQGNIILKIKNAQDEVKKAKLGSNIPKIRELIGDLYKLMEDAELDYIEQQREHEVKVTSGSIITYLDVVAEREKYQKSKNIKKAKARMSISDAYYGFFGTMGLYQKLLGREMWHKVQNVIVILDTLYNVVALCITMTMVRLVLLQLFNTVVYQASFFTDSFINLWLMGVCSAVVLRFKKPDILNLVVIGVAWIILYFVLRALIYTNFWL